jgi:hypothetical protein
VNGIEDLAKNVGRILFDFAIAEAQHAHAMFK